MTRPATKAATAPAPTIVKSASFLLFELRFSKVARESGVVDLLDAGSLAPGGSGGLVESPRASARSRASALRISLSTAIPTRVESSSPGMSTWVDVTSPAELGGQTADDEGSFGFGICTGFAPSRIEIAKPSCSNESGQLAVELVGNECPEFFGDFGFVARKQAAERAGKCLG